MNELFYFSFADLMVRVEYSREANSLRYASHRKITFDERVLIEQYLLNNVALKTDYYKKQPSLFVYFGTERQLAKDFELYHLKNTLKTLADKEQNVQASVNDLISHSMQNYYFEQIGDAILAMRQEIRSGLKQERMKLWHTKMEELVKAYNFYAAQKISVTEIVPSELQPHFGLSRQPAPEAPRVAKGEVE